MAAVAAAVANGSHLATANGSPTNALDKGTPSHGTARTMAWLGTQSLICAARQGCGLMLHAPATKNHQYHVIFSFLSGACPQQGQQGQFGNSCSSLHDLAFQVCNLQLCFFL
jgi:hypothetical protein